jgi:tripartite-type tricarboxylate transporter receptor subunit TctC
MLDCRSSRRGWLRCAACLFMILGIIPLAATAAGPAYPSRPIDFIVPWGTGGGADYLGRALAREMEPLLGVSLPVLNVPGGTGQTGLIKMRDAPAEGYTIEEVTSETVLLQVTAHPLFKMSDLTNLGIIDQQNPGLLVREESPFKKWEDIVEAARGRHVSVAFDGFGSSGDLLVNYLNRHLGTHFDLVPYAKPGERIASVLGGHNELLFTQPGDVVSYIEGKQLRPVLMFADQRDPNFPDVPASKEFGYAASFIHFRAMYVKAGTPKEIVNKLTAAVEKAVATATFQAALKREAALPNSYVPAKEAERFIEGWLKEARTIKSAH